MKNPKGYKKVPDYWWDFIHEGDRIVGIVVESDIPNYPHITTFGPDGYLKAEALIEDLKAGRIDPRRVK